MKVGTFFSGVGSPEQALNNLGIKHEIEFACDIDKYAKQTYLKNFKPKNFYTDITALDMTELSYVDLLMFGFPCQAFSIAGKRLGFEDTRGTLFYDALRYLKEHKPRYFIAENVRGLVNHDKGKTFNTIIDCLGKTVNGQVPMMPLNNLGYHIHYKILNTKNFGIPQNRERIFIVGIRDDEDNNFKFPKEILLKLKLKDILQDNTSSKYYLSEDRIKKIKPNLDKEWIADYRNDEGLRIRKNNISPCLATRKHSATDLTSMPPIVHSLYPRSGNPKQGGTGHLKKSNGTSYCLDTGNNQAIEIKSRIRRLTPIECERLQGFPDNFTEGVSDTQRYKQMGNTITVNVIQSLINNLI
jgi:DNA (cytosine-5)-methyltransferase 1